MGKRTRVFCFQTAGRDCSWRRLSSFSANKRFSVLLKEEKEKAIEIEPGKEVGKNRIKILVLSESNMKR